MTVCNIDPQHIALDSRYKAIDARIQNDLIVDSDGTLKQLALFKATALRTKQQEVHGSENGTKKEQSKQWIAIAV